MQYEVLHLCFNYLIIQLLIYLNPSRKKSTLQATGTYSINTAMLKEKLTLNFFVRFIGNLQGWKSRTFNHHLIKSTPNYKFSSTLWADNLQHVMHWLNKMQKNRKKTWGEKNSIIFNEARVFFWKALVKMFIKKSIKITWISQLQTMIVKFSIKQ